MENLAAFFSMDGYGLFVWSAFSISAILLFGILIQSKRLLRSTEKRLATLNNPIET